MVEIGSVIYTAVKPIFKIYLIIGSGFWLGRRNILTVETCKQLSNIVVLVILPTLVFDKIVTNLNNSDIKQIGIVALVSIILYIIGGLLALIVYFTTGVPKYWFGGCISSGLFPNVAELPIAYVSTLNSIFSDEEVEKGISYVIILLTTYCLLQFNFGAIMLIEMDYKTSERLEKEDEKVIRERTVIDEESGIDTFRSKNLKKTDDHDDDDDDMLRPAKVVNDYEVGSSQEASRIWRVNSRLSNLDLRKQGPEGIQSLIDDYKKDDFEPVKIKKTLQSRFKPYAFIKFFISNCTRPISLSLIVSLTIAMIPWVQALFVPSSQYQYPNAPDREPPLSFIMTFTNYLSQACVPLGILILGATLSRLSIDRTALERNVILTPLLLSLVRLVILPIIGILFVTKLKNDGWFEGDRILLFVCCICHGLPCATSLIYLAASFSNGVDYQMRSLSLVYLFQYPILSVSLPFLTTYTVMKVLDN